MFELIIWIILLKIAIISAFIEDIVLFIMSAWRPDSEIQRTLTLDMLEMALL